MTEVIGTNANGEVIRIDAKAPGTPSRTLEQLWERYKPLKIMRCYNVKTQRFFRVFNPGWQKRTTGTVKGKMANIYGKVFAGEMEIFGADDSVWIMSWFIRPEKKR